MTDRAEVLVIDARARDLGGGFVVGRVLPAPRLRAVGPFVFLDHMGPVVLPPGAGLDVRPHPHIGLSTVTYLFEGVIVHRDSTGAVQPIRPGDINWMTAGRAVTHSERSPDDERAAGAHLHGLQLWVALPHELEHTDPSFAHHPHSTLPSLELDGVAVSVLAGSAYGVVSPVVTASPLFFVVADMPAGTTLDVPDEHQERALYIVEGEVTIDGETYAPRRLLHFGPGRVSIEANADTRLAMIGGAALDGPRHIEWNFVSSDTDEIAKAKIEWKENRFPTVPGDDKERIPLPE